VEAFAGRIGTYCQQTFPPVGGIDPDRSDKEDLLVAIVIEEGLAISHKMRHSAQRPESIPVEFVRDTGGRHDGAFANVVCSCSTEFDGAVFVVQVYSPTPW
jgi:hypothetical protein